MSDIEIVITVPDEPTVGQWQIYSTARDKWASENKDADFNIAKYYGACALHTAGIAHVKGYQPLIDALKGKEHKDLPLPIFAAAVVYIAQPMESAYASPLAVSLLRSSATGLIKINGTVLRDSETTSKPETTIPSLAEASEISPPGNG